MTTIASLLWARLFISWHLLYGEEAKWPTKVEIVGGGITLSFVINLTKHDKMALKRGPKTLERGKLQESNFDKLNHVFLGNFSHLSALRDRKKN